MSSNYIGDSVNSGLPDCQREANESRRRGHVVISKWEASILNTAACREKKVDLCQRKRRQGSGLKWYLKITVKWLASVQPLLPSRFFWGGERLYTGYKMTFAQHLSLQEAAFTWVHSQSTLESSLILWNAGWLYTSMYTLDLMMMHFISAGLSLLKPHYSYFHWSENCIYTNVTFIKKIAMRRRSKVTSVLNNPKLGMNLSVN